MRYEVVTDVYNKPDKTKSIYHKCEDVVMFPSDSMEIHNAFLTVFHDSRMAGLAANQIGILSRAFHMKGVTYFNPTVEAVGDDTNVMTEGCLSFPNLFVDIKRPKRIVMEWQDVNGDRHKQVFTELEARVIQHEIDHLDGIPFFKKATKYHMDKAVKNMKKNAS